MAVGPSAAPIMPTQAASCRLNMPGKIILTPHASVMVTKMPNCAAAPNKSNFGFESRGPKSIMAPMPMNKSSGNSSLAMPARNSTSMAPSSNTPSCIWSTAPESGRFTRMAPKPMGKRRLGSISFLIAK